MFRPMRHFFYRQSLYERIWTEPPTRVAAELKITPAILKRACQCAAIPLPPMGHWARLRSGKNPEHTPLPSRPHGADCVVTVGDRFSLSETLTAPPVPEPIFEESIEAMAARLASTLPAATPAPARGNFSRIAMLHVAPPIPGKRAVLPKPSPVQLRRYQLVVDLCSLLERAGSMVDAREDEKGSRFSVAIYATFVSVYFSGDGAQQTLWLATSDESQPYPDTPERQIEDRLHEIAGALLTLAEKRCRVWAQSAYQKELESRQRAEKYEREDQRRRKERAEQRRRERAKERRDELVSQANQWNRANAIRAFVAGVLASSPADNIPPKLGGWAKWALREADAIDPAPELRRNPPERRETDNPPSA